MSQLPPSLSLDEPTAPLPTRQFVWFLWFWHVTYLVLLWLFLGMVWWNARAAWGWRELALVAGITAQSAIYLRAFIFPRRWPLPWTWLAGYFGASLGLWWLERQGFPEFRWLVFAYFGQMFGILPFRVALPSVAATLVFVLVTEWSWQGLLRLNMGELFGIGITGVLWLAVGIFFALLMRTSSERGQLITRLEAANRALALTRERDAELATLRERERLARDMHDGLGHALVALTVQLEAVQRLIAVDPVRATSQIEELKQLTRQSMAELRRSLDGLRVSGLGERPLAQALQSLSIEVGQRAHIAMTCHLADIAHTLTPMLAETLWRVAQEALTNVEKHAQARQVQISLEAQPQQLVLRVSDDGIGLPANAETMPRHYGLRGIRERVEGLGGTLTLISNHGTTTVEVRLPNMR